jgi:hypothetical protein
MVERHTQTEVQQAGRIGGRRGGDAWQAGGAPQQDRVTDWLCRRDEQELLCLVGTERSRRRKLCSMRLAS